MECAVKERSSKFYVYRHATSFRSPFILHEFLTGMYLTLFQRYATPQIPTLDMDL